MINDAFGYNFWRGSHPIMHSIYNAQSKDELQQLSNTLEHQLTPDAVSKTAGMTHRQRSAWFEALAWEGILADIPGAIRLLLTKAIVFLRPWLDPAAWSWPIVLVTGLWECGLYLSGSMGIFFVWRRSKPAATLIILYLLAGLALNLPFQVVARFRIPLYEWVFILLSAFAADEIRKNRRSTPN